jgi:hypothetical protein
MKPDTINNSIELLVEELEQRTEMQAFGLCVDPSIIRNEDGTIEIITCTDTETGKVVPV